MKCPWGGLYRGQTSMGWNVQVLNVYGVKCTALFGPGVICP